MWEKVASRSHNPLKIFPFGEKSNEVMLYGTVDYDLKDGRKASIPWAARAHLTKEEGDVKMDFYQVYLVSFWLVLYVSLLLLTYCRIQRHRIPASSCAINLNSILPSPAQCDSTEIRRILCTVFSRSLTCTALTTA